MTEIVDMEEVLKDAVERYTTQVKFLQSILSQKEIEIETIKDWLEELQKKAINAESALFEFNKRRNSTSN